MTGARHFAKQAERRRHASEKEAQNLQAGCKFSSCPSLTRFVVVASERVINDLITMGVEATVAWRPWFQQSSGPTGDGLYSVIFFAGEADADRVRENLRMCWVPEVHDG